MANRAGVKEYYDKTAADWAEKWYADDSMLPILQRLMQRLPPHPRILDLCCGAGYESMRLNGLGAEVVGLDLSEKSIAIARQRNPQLTFHTGDMRNDYGHIGMVDGIACIAGLVHLPAEELPLAFSRMAQVLRPGGYALLTVRDGEGRITRNSDVEIDGVMYDRAFFAHSLQELTAASAGLLSFAEEIPDAEPSWWRHYLFIRGNG